MNVSKEELEERFRALTDQVLLERLQAGTLTPLATEVAAAELRSRGIEVEPAPETPDSGAPGEHGESLDPQADVDLVTVAQFTNVVEANVLRNCPESHGVFAFVWGEHLGTANIFLSIVSGGVRVQVRQDQVERAKEIIAAVERGDLAIDEEPE
jgi:hypothetical protein